VLRHYNCGYVLINILVTSPSNMGRGVAAFCLSQLQRQLPMVLERYPVAITRASICGNALARGYPSSSSHKIAVASTRLLSTPRIVGPPPQLFDFIIQLRFGEVLKRAKSHPHEVRYPHPRRWTALHACVEYGAPIEVVEALIQAYPDALSVKDWRGKTPMDIALTDELKQYLASVDIDSLVGGGTEGTVTVGGVPTSADVASEDSQDALQHIDKISQQVVNLRRQCDSLESEIRMLRRALTKRQE